MVKLVMFGGAEPKATKLLKPPHIEIKEREKLASTIIALANKEGMHEDDPLRVILIGLAAEIDKFRPIIESHGPDAGRQAAEAAAMVMRQEARRLSAGIRGRALALVALSGALLAGGGAFAGWSLRGSIPAEIEGASIPRDMAMRFPLQNWPAQWAARQALPPGKDGFEWALIPFAMNPPQPPKAP